MRLQFAVRQDADTLEVRAYDEQRRRVGKLDAQVLTWEDLMEYSNEAAMDAEGLREGGEDEDAAIVMSYASRLERCARAFDHVQRQAGRKLKLFTVMDIREVKGDPAMIAAALYRTAAVAAARAGAALMAPGCTNYLFGGFTGPDYALQTWKSPGFRRGMLIAGPIAFHQESAVQKAANLR